MRTRKPHNLAPSGFPVWFPPLFFLVLAALFLWRSTFAGDVFLPANLLGHIAPWTSAIKPDNLPPWNPLRWDGIAQFYPWRNFAHDTIRNGFIPLWNPYQFCGTPFVANSQSAVFYPPNLLFYILPTARAFGVSALLHLTLCGWFSYLLLRRLGCGEAGALLAGIVYAFSNWQVQWLQLPTFLATSCWFPLLLRQIYDRGKREKGKGKRGTTGSIPSSLFPLPVIVGMMLLAGHLQIAFYGLLAGSLWAIALLVKRGREQGAGFALRRLGVLVGGLALGVMLALPQVLPSLELSRMSHRVGKPTAEGYAAYVEYSLPPMDLALLTLPNFFGNDYDTNNSYYGFYVKHTPQVDFAIRHNAAETAVYVGIIPLLLALFATVRSVINLKSSSPDKEPAIETGSPQDNPSPSEQRAARRGAGMRSPGVRWFFIGLAVLGLLLALGTPLNALFYFFVPGFAQSGSPARCLVLWALAIAALAGFGLDDLVRQKPTKRELSLVLGCFAFIFAIGVSLASQALRSGPSNLNDLKVPVFGEVISRISMDWVQLLVLVAAGTALLWVMPNPTTSVNVGAHIEEPDSVPPASVKLTGFSPSALSCLVLVTADLFLAGIRVNPTAPASAVYPTTPGVKWVQEHSGHDHIFPVNRKWSLYSPPAAVLPPNAGLVYGLRDVQGYDSLLTGQYKGFADQFARPAPDGSKNASPTEVGNMVFFQDPTNPEVSTLGAAYALTLSPTSPRFSTTLTPPADAVYDADGEMAVYPLPNALHRARLLGANGLPLPLSASIAFQQDDPTRVVLNVSITEPATLVLADQFYPGWGVRVDGKPTELQRSPENIFRAVAVPSGTHTIAFLYQPASYRVGLFLQCVACAMLALFCGTSWITSRRS